MRQTESTLVTAAQNIGKWGMDWHRYYHQQPPTGRTGNRTFPRGAVPDWNVYDHGVNNAKGAMRCPPHFIGSTILWQKARKP